MRDAALWAAYFASVAGAIWLLFSGVKRKSWMLEFPFLAGLVFAGYLLPYATVVALRSHDYPKGAVTKTLVMMSLCMAGCLAGYGRKFVPRRTDYPSINETRLFQCGLLLTAIGWAGMWKLSSLTGGFWKFFSTEGGYQLEWSGAPVIWSFFVQFVYPGILVCLICYLRKPNLQRLLGVAVGALLPVLLIVFMARRSIVIQLILIFVGPLYFYRGFAVPKKAMPLVAVVGVIVLYIGPIYRTFSQIGGDQSEILRIEPTQVVLDALSHGTGDAFGNAVFIIDTFDKTKDFGYGRGLYDGLVHYFVPKALVGAELKEELTFRGTDFIDSQVVQVSGYARPSNEFFTGVADAFTEFGYSGCLLFAVIGYLMKRYWVLATEYGSVAAQLAYPALVQCAMVSIAFEVAFFTSTYVLLTAIFGLAMWFSAGWSPHPAKRRVSSPVSSGQTTAGIPSGTAARRFRRAAPTPAATAPKPHAAAADRRV